MNAFYARNEELKNGKWMEGWRAFCTTKPVYRTSLENMYRPESTEQQNELFAHFLDCEAHTDVWRELYKTWHHTNDC